MCAHHTASYLPFVQYKICVKGRLESRWTAWFDGLTIDSGEDGTTVIRGCVADQAALHGLLARLRDLGIPLISLSELACDAPTNEGELQ